MSISIVILKFQITPSMTRKILDLPVVSHSSKAVSILLLTCQSQIRLEHERYADWESNNVVTEEYDTSPKSLSAAASHNTNPTTLFYNGMKCMLLFYRY